jgi:transcriptional repressor NrdR
VPTTRIGELAMEALAQLDEVAYVRFASVYRDFATVRDFEEFIRQLPEDQDQPVIRPRAEVVGGS